VGYKQRERKRRKEAAQKRARAVARAKAETLRDVRRDHGHKLGSSRSKWWLTPLRSTACCARCAVVIREGRDAVYRHEPREVRCIRCADGLEDSKGYRPSLQWERKRSAERRRPRG
jgi:hypothetical protein